MKKILPVLLISILFSVGSFAQKKVMLEMFTNASCGPCAGENPRIDNLAAQNPDKLVVLKYHWYFPGYDPMHNNNVGENLSRASYYQVNYVPQSHINGSLTTPNQSVVDNQYNNDPVIDINVYQKLDKENKIFSITAIVDVLEDVQISMPKLYLAAVEDVVTFTSAPGGNGEKVFRDVFVKFMPNQSGNPLPEEMEAGDYYMFHYDWDYSGFTIYDEDQLNTRAFVQGQNKNIYYATKGTFYTGDIEALAYNNDAEVLGISGIPEYVCANQLSPEVTIRNNGKDPLTSAVIKYRFNDETEYEYTWEGSLGRLESEVVTLNEVSCDLLAGKNTITAEIVSVNGGDDEYPKNNTKNYTFNSTYNTNEKLYVTVLTDDAPEETTWKVTKTMTGEVIAQGGPYTEAGAIIQDTVYISEQDCYTFTVYDAGGNGLCCENGTGVVGVETDDKKVILEASEFKDSLSLQFSANGYLSVEDLTFSENFEIYPNPSDGLIFLNVNTNNNSNVFVDVYSVTGVKMYSNNYNVSKGSNVINLDLTNFPLGLYIVKIQQNGNIQSSKIIIK